MKVGIVTYHRSHNYGALLQAIALRYYLTRKGHEVFFVDYWPEYHKRLYSVISIGQYRRLSFGNYISYLFNCVRKYSIRKERFHNFELFIEQYITPYLASVNDKYDLLIHGSDQIWRIQPEINRLNPFYFGDSNIKACKRASYAASMGAIKLSKEEIQQFKHYLSYLDFISVRELELKTFVESLGYKCEQHVDPALLLSGDEWCRVMQIKTENKRRDYILFYDLLSGSFDMDEVRQFAENNDYDIITIYGSASKQNTENEITTAGPDDFLSLVHGASFVLTSSFHGLVFSILFHKPFFAAFSMNEGRARSLLLQLGLENNLLKPMSSLSGLSSDIDYALVEIKLADIKRSSQDYLDQITDQ